MNLIQFIVEDVGKLVSEIEAGLKWFTGAAQAAVNWVDKNVPGAQAVVATLIKDGDDAMVGLEQYASSYGSDLINNLIASAEQLVANHLQATGLNLTTKTTLNADAVAGLKDVSDIGQLIMKAATTKVIATTNQIATAVKPTP